MSSKNMVAVVALCLMVVAVAAPALKGLQRARAEASAPSACTPPAQELESPEETAWHLFVASVCTANAIKYPFTTWETWIEQSQLYQAQTGPFAHVHIARFHKSPLAEFLRKSRANPKGGSRLLLLVPNQGCDIGSSGRTICEETRINPDAANYITANALTTVAGQRTFALAGKPFVFTRPSVEIKADWVQLSSCLNPPSDVHVENVGGACYALAGFHMISKLIDKWVWATFEPQNTTTNPNRCKILGCSDSWGSRPTTTNGRPTELSKALSQLMNDAGLAPEWKNYRLDGVQVDFFSSSGQPTVLGNSIIEGDTAGNPALLPRSSCITCHARSTVAVGLANALGPSFVVGGPPALQPGVIGRDFVWSLAQAR